MLGQPGTHLVGGVRGQVVDYHVQLAVGVGGGDLHLPEGVTGFVGFR